MIASGTFSKFIKEHFSHTPMRVGYWRIYKDRLWRLCGSKAYKGRRTAILARYKKQRKRWGTRRLTDLISKDFILLDTLMDKDLAPKLFKMREPGEGKK